MNMKKLMIIYSFFLSVVLLIFMDMAFAENILFGPEKYVRGKESPTQDNRTFTIEEPGDHYKLVIDNGPEGADRVSSATIILNGKTVFETEDFNHQVGSLIKRVSLKKTNELSVKLQSAPGSALTIKILRPSAADIDPPHVVVDINVVPSALTIDGIDGGPERPLERLLSSSGRYVDFVENEVYLITSDSDVVTEFINRWNGHLNFVVDPSSLGVTGQPSIYLITVDPSSVDTGNLDVNLALVDDRIHGQILVTSESGKELLAVVAYETVIRGLNVGLNIILPPAAYQERETSESFRLRHVDDPDTRPIYTSNAFEWPYMNRGSEQDTGVAEAWRVLDATGKFTNRIPIYVADAGFRPNNDFPADYHILGGLRVINPDPTNCGADSPSEDCQWHGTHVTLSAMGSPDNNFGTAGPGGPVANPVMIQSPSPDFTSIVRYIIRAVEALGAYGHGIINVSASTPIVAGLCPIVCGPLDSLSGFLILAGDMLVAAAGNDGEDVDAWDQVCLLFGVSGCIKWEEATIIPCEIEGVMCVGALDWDTNVRARFSNYGSDSDDCCTVDMFAPGVLWSVASPVDADEENDAPDDDIDLIQGTSFATPFVSGVAALVWAANPTLTVNQVENILLRTAHVGGGFERGWVWRWINALGAVQEALGGDTPPYINIISPSDGESFPGGSVSVSFRADTEDLEDETSPSVVWVSDRDGTIGTGSIVGSPSLSIGTHIITATATDSTGNHFSDSVTITITNQAPTVYITTFNPPDPYQSQSIELFGVSYDPNLGGSLGESQVAWYLDGSSSPFATGHSAIVSGNTLSIGTHTIHFTGDDGDLTSTDSRVVYIRENPSGNIPPVAIILRPGDRQHFLADQYNAAVDKWYAEVSLCGYGDDGDVELWDGSNVTWYGRTSEDDIWQILAVGLGEGYCPNAKLYLENASTVTTYTIKLFVIDSEGATGETTITVYVEGLI